MAIDTEWGEIWTKKDKLEKLKNSIDADEDASENKNSLKWKWKIEIC